MATSRDLVQPLGRARMLFAMLSSPALREGMAQMLLGEGASAEPSVRGPLSQLDWLQDDGEVQLEPLRETTAALSLMRSDQAILEVGRLDGIPVKTEESRETSARIARIVFARIGEDRVLSESALNAAIAMFAADVALVRRDAVDAGVLARSADGAEYRLAGAA